MHYPPMLLLHICAGTVGLLSGFVAIALRKGSRRHGLAGDVFVVSMLLLGATGAYLGFMKDQMLNGLMGLLTFYLVGTAWLTARHRDGETGKLDWAGLLVVLAVAAVMLSYGFKAVHSPTGSIGGYAPGFYFGWGTVALLFAAGDVRMLVRGGVSGNRRIARHLSRMCIGWFIASASVFLARQHIFPALIRRSGVLYFLTILPLLMLVFWLIRVKFARRSVVYIGQPIARVAGD